MATIKDIKISREWAVRRDNGTSLIEANHAWHDKVKTGDKYDLVQFSINELDKPYYWRDSLCFPLGMSEEDIRKEVVEYAESIPEQAIKDYLSFLNMGEKYGWD